jgi:hypothetical protein
MSMGQDLESGGFYLAIPVINRLADYDEQYALSPAEFDHFRNCPEDALAFAEAARRREMDDRLIVQPGSDRGTPL